MVGISVILCCFNSEKRLPITLQHLAAQDFKHNWEVILVDNNSTDYTIITASKNWRHLGEPTTLKVISEEKQGLSFARMAGINASSGKYVLFCDDDNWLAHTYLTIAFQFLEANPATAACGGLGIPQFEIPAPEWFGEYQEAFATGPQDINNVKGKLVSLYGAGMTLNVSHLKALRQKGFRNFFSDRSGNSLASSGDTEITNAFVISGSDLAYLPDLQFKHFIPSERLQQDYLHRLFRAFGQDGPVLNIYYSFLPVNSWHHKVQNRYFHLSLALFRTVKYLVTPPKKRGRTIYFGWSMNYIRSLLTIWKQHGEICRRIASLHNESPPA